MTKKGILPPSEADPAWKTLLEVYFPQLMKFFWPSLYEQIDWSGGFESLESELQAVSRQAAIGKRLVDKLFQVYSKTGQPWRVLTHLEVQGQQQSAFEQRLFEYYCRIYLLKGLPLITLVILVDDDKQWRPQSYEIRLWDQPVIRFDFQTVKILDYQGREAELAADPNPFAAVVLAQLAALKTKHDPQRRFEMKWHLTRQLYEKQFTKQEIQHLYLFMDWVLTLPVALEAHYHQQIEQFEKEQKMEFITGMERRGIKKGFQQGELAVLWRLLKHRFRSLSQADEAALEQKLAQADADTLLEWSENLLEAETLDQVFKSHSRP